MFGIILRRYLSIVLCAVCLTLNLTVNADVMPYLTAETEQTENGYVVHIGISRNPGFAAVRLKVDCSKAPERIEKGTLLQDGMFETDFDIASDKNKFNIVYVGLNNITSDGILTDIYFNEGGLPEVTVSVENGDAINEKYGEIKIKSAISKSEDNVKPGNGSNSSGGGSSSSGRGKNYGVVVPSESEKENSVSVSFKDVSSDDWFFDAVSFISKNGYMNGTGHDIFNPYESLSRAMLVTVLWRVSGEPESKESPFADISEGMWYTEAVNYAFENGIVNGVSERYFAPDDKITREQIAAIIYRYAKKIGIDVAKVSSVPVYTDVSDISEYAFDAVTWCIAKGIMNGRGNGMFAPSATATRAEAAAVLMRFISEYNVIQ